MELATPGSAVRLATQCATGPSRKTMFYRQINATIAHNLSSADFRLSYRLYQMTMAFIKAFDCQIKEGLDVVYWLALFCFI